MKTSLFILLLLFMGHLTMAQPIYVSCDLKIKTYKDYKYQNQTNQKIKLPIGKEHFFKVNGHSHIYMRVHYEPGTNQQEVAVRLESIRKSGRLIYNFLDLNEKRPFFKYESRELETKINIIRKKSFLNYDPNKIKTPWLKPGDKFEIIKKFADLRCSIL